MTDHQKLIDDYLEAFRAANKLSTPPDITYSRGWFVMKSERHYPQRYRKAKLDRMRDTLLERVRAST